MAPTWAVPGLFNLLQNCSKKEITREHSAKSIQLVEVDELTPGKY